MPKRSKKASAFDLPKSFDIGKLEAELQREIQDAWSARASIIGDGGLIDLLDWFYEQGRSDPEDRPFVGAADLTSFFITENVDAYRSRLMRAVFGVEPFCVVDGWGDDAKKAPFVEAFHEWQVDEEGLPEELAKIAHGALIEDAMVLEVRERIETRKSTEQLDVALATNDFGGPIIGPDGQPQLKTDESGDFVPAKANEAAARVEMTSTKTKRLGPEYEVISMKDFLFLPGHARNQKQVWGYAYRTFARLPEIDERVADGLYDAEAVKKLGTASDREASETTPPKSVDGIAPQLGDAVEKELWVITLKRDFDGDGREEWYTGTMSVREGVLLRMKLDTFVQRVGIPRCVPFVLFPRRNSVYGYSYAGDKMLTLAEEHTSLRNMKADRGSLATNAPLKVKNGALWDWEAEPIGVGRIIHVREHDDVMPMEIPDVPPSIVEQERALFMAKERVGGLSDMAVGVQPGQSRTLGENEMVASGSAVRVEETLGFFRQSIKKVMRLRHAIWIETLEGDSKGLEAPSDVLDRLAGRGVQLQGGRFTAELLKGKFRFKPYGSTETADVNRRMQYFNTSLQALGGLAKEFPAFQAIFNDPDVVQSVMDEWLRIFKIRNRGAFQRALQTGLAKAPALPAATDASGTAPMGGQPNASAPAPGGAPPSNLMAALSAIAGRGAPAGAGPGGVASGG